MSLYYRNDLHLITYECYPKYYLICFQPGSRVQVCKDRAGGTAWVFEMPQLRPCTAAVLWTNLRRDQENKVNLIHGLAAFVVVCFSLWVATSMTGLFPKPLGPPTRILCAPTISM